MGSGWRERAFPSFADTRGWVTCSECKIRRGQTQCCFPLRGRKVGQICARPLCFRCARNLLCPAHAALVYEEAGLLAG